MKRLVLILIAVTVLVATAGCTGVLEEEPTDSAEVDSGGDETTDPEANEIDETNDYPYSTDEGSLDVGKLASRQAAIFDGESYTVEIQETTEDEVGTYEQSVELVVDGDRWMQKRHWETDPSTADSVLVSAMGETWSFRESVTETLVRRADGSDERYRVMGPAAPATEEQSLRKEVTAMLRVSGYERTAVEQTDDGTVATYEGTGMSDDFEHLYPTVEEFDVSPRRFTSLMTASSATRTNSRELK